MKIDPLIEFILPDTAVDFLAQYASPDSEASVAKDIPLDQLELSRQVMRMISRTTGKKMRLIYRGPRHDLTRSWCRRRDARRIAIYFR